MERLTVRVDEDVKDQLAAIAARKGVQPTTLAREYIDQGVLSDKERLYAPLVRRAVREELESFLQASTVRREFAADDFYDRLSAELRMDLDDCRAVAGATLFLAATLAEHGGAAFEGTLPDRDEWCDLAAEAGFRYGLGLRGAAFAPRDGAPDEAPQETEGDDGVLLV